MKTKYLSIFVALLASVSSLLLWNYNRHVTDPGITGQEAWLEEIAEKRAEELCGETEAEMDGPDQFQLYEKGIRTRENETHPGYAPNYRFKALAKAKTSRFAAARTANVDNGITGYVERGPSNVPGRTRGLLVLPGDTNQETWLAGSSGGGIWKTTNSGSSWVNKSPNFPSLAVATLAMSASNSSIIYAGTGEYIASAGTAIEGDGIFKSIDGGETWEQLSSTASNSDFVSITRIIVDPEDPDVLLACNAANTWDTGANVFKSNIMKSTNGGDTWSKVFTVASGNAIEQLIFEPGNFNIQYASQNGIGVLKSTDAGDTWNLSNTGMNPSGRLEIAVSPVNTNRLFASTVGEISSTGSDLYISEDAGANWDLVNVAFSGSAVDFLGGQGWYDNTILCDPFDEDVVYFGGAELFKLTIGTSSTNNGYYDLENNTDFVSFVNFGTDFAEGALDVSANANEQDIEIRFGSGRSQFAHRFTVPADGGTNGDGGAGISPSSYEYVDYVTVPFEVWEVDNDGNDIQQLMVSFRDQQNDGVFNLNTRDDINDPQLLNSREYLFVNDIAYSTSPSPTLMVNGGQEVDYIYNVWPILAEGASWDANNLPTSNFKLFYNDYESRNATTLPVIDVYSRYNGINPYVTNGTDVHPDQHNMVAIVTDDIAKKYKILLSNDGGVFVSDPSTKPGTNDGDWNFAGSTYNTSQFYGADKMPGGNRYLGGMQDNGTWVSPKNIEATASTAYDFAVGGDGFEALWHSLDPNKLIGGSQNNGFRRSLNGGTSWTDAVNGLTGTFPFISKLATSKDLPDVIYSVSSDGVFVSDDFGGQWELTPITEKWGGSTFLDVDVSRANASIVWAGSGMSDERNLHVSTDRGATFHTVDNFTDVTLGSITRLATHPIEDSTAYALFSFAEGPKVLKTMDLGQTWADISGFRTETTSSNGFPDVAVYCLYVRPDNPDIIWVGSEIGIIESLDNGASWHMLDEFPNVSVWDMKGQDNQIVIATHGRGIWTAMLDTDQTGSVLPATINDIAQSPKNDLKILSELTSDFDSLEVYQDGSKIATFKTLAAGNYILTIGKPVNGSINLKILSYIGGAPYQSSTKEFDALSLSDPVKIYTTNFTSGSNFDQSSFTVSALDGDQALQTAHNYRPNDELTSVLKTPIIVDETYPLISYKNVALVEPDNDFVAVEATKDGFNWDLLAQYDASQHTEWSDAFNNNESGVRFLYKEQTIDLSDTYADGDTLLIRFRLSANESVNGWGWAIDNVYIQEEPTGLGDPFAVQQLNVYPNPSHGVINIKSGKSLESTLQARLYNNAGQLVKKYSLKKKDNGEYQIVDKNLKAGIYILNVESELLDKERHRIIIE